MQRPRGQIRALSAPVRFAITCLLLVTTAGMAASVAQIYLHHHNRDEQPDFTLTDLEGSYHGVTSQAPLLTALLDHHPQGIDGATEDDILTEDERQLLIDWLNSDRISEDYDNLDLGDSAPAEIISMYCLDCHSQSATRGTEASKALALEYWEDVRAVAFSVEIEPTPIELLITSTHTHALGLMPVGLLLIGLLAGSRWPGGMVGVLSVLIGFGLLVDISGWWVSRYAVQGIWLVMIGGGMFVCGSLLGCAAVLGDLWWPMRREA